MAVVTLTGDTRDDTRRSRLTPPDPGWAREAPVPSDLYRFAEPRPHRRCRCRSTACRCRSMSRRATRTSHARGRPATRSRWICPMPPVASRRIRRWRPTAAASPSSAARSSTRPSGPTTTATCATSCCQTTAVLASEFRPSLLGGVQVVTAPAVALSRDKDDAIVRATRVFNADPVCDVGQPGPGPDGGVAGGGRRAARPRPFPTLATRSTVTTSPARRSPRFINDGEDARVVFRSGVRTSTGGRARARPRGWNTHCRKPQRSIGVAVYWFDDTGRGEVRVPASWSLQYKDGDTWRPVQGASTYGTARDASERRSRSRQCARPHSASTSTCSPASRPGFRSGFSQR